MTIRTQNIKIDQMPPRIVFFGSKFLVISSNIYISLIFDLCKAGESTFYAGIVQKNKGLIIARSV